MVSLFGGLQVTRNGTPIAGFRTRKAGLLLAYLALTAGQQHAREVLAERFWTDCPPETARHNLRMALSHLRAALGEQFPLRADRQTVCLPAEAVTTDVARFEQALHRIPHRHDAELVQSLETAISLYTGAFLPDCYDDWAIARQQALEEAFVQAACQLIDALTARGDREQARAVAHQALIRAPHRQEIQERRTTLPELPPPPTGPLPHVLPLYLTRFLGRESEIALLEKLLSHARLITLTGPGGVGKTRLACALGERQHRRAVWFVPILEVCAPALLPGALRQAMNLPPLGSETDPLASLSATLNRETDPLLIFDNLEQVDTAPFLTALLERVPHLTCLCTTRRTLGIEGEQVVPIEPLPETESIALFVERARAVRPDFAQDTDAVTELCRQLDGLPLALELAAARVGVLTPGQMAGDLGVLYRRTGIGKHRSLRATIQWSYDLLPTRLQRLFCTLSVFRGGWTLGTARAITGDPDVLDALEELRAHSLIQSEAVGVEMRFTLLETLRTFAEEQLSPDEKNALDHRHAECFMDFVEMCLHRSVEDFSTQTANDDQLERERENWRAALAFCAVEDIPLGLRLAGYLGFFWYRRGYAAEGKRCLETLLSKPYPNSPQNEILRGRAYATLGSMCQAFGDIVLGMETAEMGVAILSAFPDDIVLPWAYHHRGLLATIQGHWDQAEADHKHERMLFVATNDRHGEAMAQHNLGVIAVCRGRNEEAEALYRQCLLQFREEGDPYMTALTLNSRAHLCRMRGELGEATQCANEAIELYRQAGSVGGTADVLLTRTMLAIEQLDWQAAHTYAQEAFTLFTQLGTRWAGALMEIHLATIALYQNQYATGHEHIDHALTVSQSLGRRVGIGYCLHIKGMLVLRGDRNPAAADALLREAEAIYHETHFREDLPSLLLARAEAAWMQGNTTRARHLFQEADAALSPGQFLPPLLHRQRTHVQSLLDVNSLTLPPFNLVIDAS